MLRRRRRRVHRVAVEHTATPALAFCSPRADSAAAAQAGTPGSRGRWTVVSGRDVTENPLAASPAHEESMDSRLEARVAELEQQLAVMSAAEGERRR